MNKETKDSKINNEKMVSMEEFLRRMPLELSKRKDVILDLRQFVLSLFLDDQNYEISDMERVKIWKLLLGVPIKYDAEDYIRKIELGPSSFDSKIRDDTFRTFKNNEVFWERVKEEQLIRILNITAVEHGYVQGMNVLLGPLLFVMPNELDAYYCFSTLITEHIPTYIQKNLDGVFEGVKLLDKCLKTLDPSLHTHILSKIPDLTIISFRYVLTLMASSRPLMEVLKLWDAIFAFGAHFSIVLLSVHFSSLRVEILNEKKGAKIISIIENAPIQSQSLVKGALKVLPQISTDLFGDMVQQTTSLKRG